MPVYVETPTVTLPFPGLRPFRRDEFEIFFGREEHVAKLAQMLQARHFVAVVGPSGCGKSSLVTAGLLPALAAGHAVDIEGPWYEASIRPGDRPYSRLAEALIANGVLPDHADEDLASRIGFLGAELRRGPLGLIEALDGAKPLSDGNLLIVVDQFEEIFRFRHEESDQEADAFVALLLETVRQVEQRKLSIYVMLTMRSDYLGACNQFSGLPEAISDSQFLTPRPNREQRHAAIVGPAAMFGGEVESALVNRLLNDMGDDPDQLPIMQHALMRMWSLKSLGEQREHGGQESASTSEEGDQPVVLTTDIYDEVGGWRKALSNHADEALDGLGDDPERQRVAERLFRSLTHRGPNQNDVRRPVSVQQVAAVADVSTAIVKEVVNAFRRSDRCFLTPGLVEGDPRCNELADDDMLDISHESLIRNWDRLRGWAEEEGESAVNYVRLEDAARRKLAGKAAYLQSPELDLALKWRDETRPTAAWARRYGADFQLAMQYLDDSQAEKQRLDAEAESQRLALATEQARADHAADTARRNRRQLRAIGVLAILLAIAWGFAFRQTIFLRKETDYAHKQETEAKKQTDIAEKRKADAEQQRVMLTVTRGTQLIQNGDIAGASLWFAEALRLGIQGGLDEVTNQVTSKRLASGLRQLPLLSQLWRNKDGTSAVEFTTAQFSLDGQLVLAAGRDGKARLWDVHEGNELGVFAHEDGPVLCASVSPDGDIIATAGSIFGSTNKGIVRVWRRATGELIREFNHEKGGAKSVVFSPNPGRYLAMASGDTESKTGEVQLWDRDTDEVRSFDHRAPVAWVVFSPDGSSLATASGAGADGAGGAARVWNLNNPSDEPILIMPHKGSVNRVAFSPSSSLVVTASGSPQDKHGEIQVWDYDSRERKWPKNRHKEKSFGVTTAEFSPCGKFIISGSLDAAAHLWLAETGDYLAVFRHNSSVFHASFSPDGRYVATASRDRTAKVWEVATKSLFMPPMYHTSTVSFAEFNPAGGSLLTKSKDVVRVWKLGTGNPPPRLVNPRGALLHATCSENGRFLVTTSDASYDEVIRTTSPACQVWDLDNETVRVNLDPDVAIQCARLSSEGQWLVTANQDGVIELRRIQGGKFLESQEIAAGLKEVNDVAVAVDGRFVAVGLGDVNGAMSATGELRIWDTTTQREVVVQGPQHRGGVINVTFDSTGSRVSTASADDSAKAWSLDTGEPIGKPFEHTADVTHASFSHDGRHVVTASLDLTAVVWDVNTGEKLATLRFDSFVKHACFSPDDRFLLTACSDGKAHVWYLASRLTTDGDQQQVPFIPELVTVLDHGDPLFQASFAGTDRVVTIGDYNYDSLLPNSSEPARRQVRTRTWNISPDNNIRENAAEYAGLLAARCFSRDRQDIDPVKSKDFDRLWSDKYRAKFSFSDSQ